MFVVSMGTKKTIKYFFPFRKEISKNKQFGLGFDFDEFEKLGDIGTKLNLIMFVIMILSYRFQWTYIAFVAAMIALVLFVLPLVWVFLKSYTRTKVTGDETIFISSFDSDWSSKYISSGLGNSLISLGILVSGISEKYTFIPGYFLLFLTFVLVFRNSFYYFKYRNKPFIVKIKN